MTGRVSFGEFVLDADTRELRRGSKSIPLSPKAYQLLETLVANRPKALSKIVLQEAAVARHVRGREEHRQPRR